MQKKARKAVFQIIPSALFIFVFTLSVCVMASNSQNQVNDCQCRGIDKSGAAIDQDILSKRLHNHKLTQSAGLSGVSTYCCNFSNQNLSHIIISSATLVKANFQNTDLTGVNLTDVDLTGADLSGVTLSGVTLIGTKINGVKFDNAIIDENHPLIFQPEIDNSSFTIADVISLANVQEGNLRALRFTGKDSLALEALLKKFNDYGFKSHAKEIIYAIKKSEMDEACKGKEGLKGYVSYLLKLVLFEVTCQWGLYPANCLFLIIFTIFVFSLGYMIALGAFKKIWARIIISIFFILLIIFGYIGFRKERFIINAFGVLFILAVVIIGIFIYLKLHKKECEKGEIKPYNPFERDQSKKICELPNLCSLEIFGMALYFSFISAFNIGWRELNIGYWISRIQPHEYSYKATGWVKVIAGFESLICTYLLALWVLTYFGSPFNW